MHGISVATSRQAAVSAAARDKHPSFFRIAARSLQCATRLSAGSKLARSRGSGHRLLSQPTLHADQQRRGRQRHRRPRPARSSVLPLPVRAPDCAFRPSRRPPTLLHLAKFGSLECLPRLRSNVSVPRDLQEHGTHNRSVFRGFAATVARFAVPPPSELSCSPRAASQLPTVPARHTSSRRPCGEAGATHPRLRRQAIGRYPAMDGRVARLRGWPDSLTPVFHRRVWRYSTVEPQDERCRRWRSCAASYAPVKPGASEASASLCRRLARPGAAPAAFSHATALRRSHCLSRGDQVQHAAAFARLMVVPCVAVEADTHRSASAKPQFGL